MKRKPYYTFTSVVKVNVNQALLEDDSSYIQRFFDSLPNFKELYDPCFHGNFLVFCYGKFFDDGLPERVVRPIVDELVSRGYGYPQANNVEFEVTVLK